MAEEREFVNDTSTIAHQIIHFRPAEEKDVPGILWMMQSRKPDPLPIEEGTECRSCSAALLAEYSNMPDGVTVGQKELLQDGFGKESYFKVILAELDSDSCQSTTSSSHLPDAPLSDQPPPPSASMKKHERLVGYALYFFNYSWKGRILYMEDLFIRKEYRNKGYGTALMKECAKVAAAKNCSWMTWQVLDWNTKALALYERVGGVHLEEYLTIRMVRPNILKFIS